MNPSSPNNFTGANAGEPRPLPLRARRAARGAQSNRWNIDSAAVNKSGDDAERVMISRP
jgi:hypothetical protein